MREGEQQAGGPRQPRWTNLTSQDPEQRKRQNAAPDGEQTQSGVARAEQAGPSVQQQVVEWRARVRQEDCPEDASGSGRRVIVLGVALEDLRELRLARFDEIAKRGLRRRSRMLQAVAGRHGQGEYFVAPQAGSHGCRDPKTDSRQHEHKHEQDRPRRAVHRCGLMVCRCEQPNVRGGQRWGQALDGRIATPDDEPFDGEFVGSAAACPAWPPRIRWRAQASRHYRAGAGRARSADSRAVSSGRDHFYPLGYHHILHRDRVLLYFLDLIGALPDVRWRRIRMLFHLGGRGLRPRVAGRVPRVSRCRSATRRASSG